MKALGLSTLAIGVFYFFYPFEWWIFAFILLFTLLLMWLLER